MIERELRLHEVEKKQRELVREQKSVEEEKRERSIRLETLQQETDQKLARVRQKAALTTLEAQLDGKLDDNEVIDVDLVFDDEEPQTEDVPSTYFNKDEIPPPHAEDPLIYEPLNIIQLIPSSPYSQINLASLSTAYNNARKRLCGENITRILDGLNKCSTLMSITALFTSRARRIHDQFSQF